MDGQGTGARYAPAEAWVAALGLTPEQVAGRLLETATGESFGPTQIRLSWRKAQLDGPVALLLQPEPARGWESLLVQNRAALQREFEARAGQFLAQGDGAAPIGARLAAVQEVLSRAAATVQAGQGRLRAEYDQVHGALRQQQQALTAPRAGLFEALFRVPFDAARAAQLWNSRESLCLRLDAGAAAGPLLLACAARLDEAGRNLGAWRALAEAAVQVLELERTAQRGRLAEAAGYLPDLTLDHAGIAALLARQDAGAGAALGLVFAPPAAPETVLAELRAAAGTAARERVAALGLAEALELQRQAEGLPAGVNGLLLLGQAVLRDGCLRRGWAWTTRPGGRRLLFQLTPDGRPLFQAPLDRGTLASVAGAPAGQVAFLELIEEIAPADLAVVGQAWAALDAAQGRQNAVLLAGDLPLLSETVLVGLGGFGGDSAIRATALCATQGAVPVTGTLDNAASARVAPVLPDGRAVADLLPPGSHCYLDSGDRRTALLDYPLLEARYDVDLGIRQVRGWVRGLLERAAGLRPAAGGLLGGLLDRQEQARGQVFVQVVGGGSGACGAGACLFLGYLIRQEAAALRLARPVVWLLLAGPHAFQGLTTRTWINYGATLQALQHLARAGVERQGIDGLALREQAAPYDKVLLLDDPRLPADGTAVSARDLEGFSWRAAAAARTLLAPAVRAAYLDRVANDESAVDWPGFGTLQIGQGGFAPEWLAAQLASELAYARAARLAARLAG